MFHTRNKFGHISILCSYNGFKTEIKIMISQKVNNKFTSATVHKTMVTRAAVHETQLPVQRCTMHEQNKQEGRLLP